MGKYIYQAFLEPDDEGGYVIEFPDLPGCISEGNTYAEAVAMGADAARTYVASLLAHKDPIPEPRRATTPDGCESVMVFFEADPSYVVSGEVVSAAEASRTLGVSPGRITQMIDSGLLDGYRNGRRTWVTIASVNARKASAPKAGRPKKTIATA